MKAGTWADWAEASWLSDELRGRPHITLECGHLSPPGSGPLAEVGWGYCRYHGVTRIVPPAEITSPGNRYPVSGGLNEARASEHGAPPAGTQPSPGRRRPPGQPQPR